MIALPLLLACSETGVQRGEPNLVLEPRTVDFGEIERGLYGSVALSIENDGIGTLSLDSVILDQGTSSPEFQILPLEGDEVLPGDVLTVGIQYVPTAVGQDYGTLLIDSNDPDESRVEVLLTAFGTEPVIDIDPETVWFGMVPVGESLTRSVTVAARGTGTLRIQDATLAGKDGAPEDAYSLAWPSGFELPYALPSGYGFDLEITFAPSDTSAHEAELVFTSNDPQEPQAAVALLGNTKDDPTGNALPVVEIADPNWGEDFLLGQAITVTGSVWDEEDGPETLLCSLWVGSTPVGSGSPDDTGQITLSIDEATTAGLLAGESQIRLVAMDSEGAVGSDSVDVTFWDPDQPLVYTLSGGSTVFEYWSVDDDVTIELNGSVIFADTNHTQDDHPPFTFEAERGDTLHIVATDYNTCRLELDALTLHFGTGISQPLVDAACRSACEDDTCFDGSYEGPWPSVFLDETVVIAIP
jgi:hypothetical protein